MKKLINLIALIMLVSVNIILPFSYAATENFEDNVENIKNEIENTEQHGGDLPLVDEEKDDNEQTEFGGENQTSDNPQIPILGNILNEDVQEDEYTSTDNTLFQIRDFHLTDMDNNPVQLYRDGEIVSAYTGLSQAIDEAESGDMIKLIDNISVSEASVVSGKSLTINGNNHTITREADITTITVNEDSSLTLQDIMITDNAENFAPNRYDSLINAKSNIPSCLGGVIETKNENGEVIASVCDTTNVDVAKTNPQIYSVGDIYGDNLIISNSLNSKGSAAIIVEKGGIEMVNSNFIHNGASGTANAGRGGAIRIGPNTVTGITDESPVTKILFSGCYFEGNYARTYGGAIAIHYAPEVVTIDNCIFSGNTAYSNGGAIQILNIWYKLGGSNASFWISSGSNFPIGTMYVNNSDFYNNWCGNDGAAIENDDINLEVNKSDFEHNYGTQPLNTSVGVISCQAGSDEGGGIKEGRGGIYREYKIKGSTFKDTNTTVLGDHNAMGSFFVDNCSFENQSKVILGYNGRGEIKNSNIKNSNPFGNCGVTGSMLRDIDIRPYSDYLSRMEVFGESTFKLENNTYSNNCITNEYFHVRNINYTTGKNNIIIENERETKIFVHMDYYDSANIQGTNEIYYGAIIDGGKYAYIKKNEFYNFDEFNGELQKFSYGNSGYQLESGKTMLFYLDSGYIELWSGLISTTTNLYGKEVNIYNIIYEGMDGVDFEGITHTYKFNNLGHTQYLTELTPYVLNNPSREGYNFEGRFLDSGYTTPLTSIGTGTMGSIILYAKWECADGYNNQGGICVKKPSRSGGGGGRSSINKTEDSKENNNSNKVDSFNVNGGLRDIEKSEDKNESINKESSNNSEVVNTNNNYTEEFNKAYKFSNSNKITSALTIKDAKMYTPITRIQMAKMLSKYAMNVLNQEPDPSIGVIKFHDVTNKMNVEYEDAVTLAYQLKIMGINMPNNEFRPNDIVTRGEFVTALSRLLYGTSDGEYKSTSKYYVNHMKKLKEEGIITKDDPNMEELRGYVMIMLMRNAK